jgi:hypothetical protein
MAGIGWYNGWSPQERTATLPVHKAALKDGRLARPTHCSICQCAGSNDWRSDDAVWLHNEDYGNPFDVYHLCRRCHRTLHERFDQPEPWLELVVRHDNTEAAWYAQLTAGTAAGGLSWPTGLVD